MFTTSAATGSPADESLPACPPALPDADGVTTAAVGLSTSAPDT